MLVLSRKRGQHLTIGDNITVAVSRITGNRVTLAVLAPKDTKVLRGELECQQGSDGKDKGGRTANQ